MPWTLLYPLQTLEERAAYRREVTQLRESPDVEFIGELRRGSSSLVEPVLTPPWPERVVLIVRFHDELERTDNPVLLSIHERRIIQSERDRQPPPPPPTDLPLDEQARQRIVSEYIQSPTGRTRLAASMVQPLRQRMDYSAIGRRTFLVEQLPEGALPIYDRDPEVTRTLNFGDAFTTPLQAGNSARIIEAYGGRSRIDGLTGMTPASLGRYIEIHGSSHSGNNGIFQIVEFFSPTSVWILSQFGAQNYGPHNWAEHVGPPPEPLLTRPILGFEPVDHQFMEVSMVADPPDPRAVLRQDPRGIRADLESMHGMDFRQPAWTRILDDSFLEDD